ncbi:MMPL family transporter [Streptomyces sp. NPDC006658]|uniref:MMPL family transporter n=1 Tax=Streptomyces sp. NPDC006658 TaxID=3156900 RepID=UPI0033F35FD6
MPNEHPSFSREPNSASSPTSPRSAKEGPGRILTILADWSVRHRRYVLLCAAAFIAISAVVGHGVSSRLLSGGWQVAGSPSQRAAALLREDPAGAPDLLLLAATPKGPDAPDARDAGLRLLARLQNSPQVRSVSAYWTAPPSTRDKDRTKGEAPPPGPDGRRQGAPATHPLLSADGRSVLIPVRLAGRSQNFRSALDQLLPQVTGRHGPLRVTAAGTTVTARGLQQHSAADLTRTEVLAAPVALLLLLLIFGSLPAACLPLAVAAISVTGTLALLRGLSALTDMSTFALNVTTAVGLALSIDYSLFVVARFREESAAGRTVHEAVIEATRTAGRTVLVAAAAVITGLLGLLIFPMFLTRSLAYAGISVVILTAAAVLLVVPAALACFGDRFFRGDLFARWRRGTDHSPTGWYRLAHRVMRRPVTVTVAVTGILLILALPFRDVRFSFSDDRTLPATSAEAKASQFLRTNFPQARNEVEVLLPNWPTGTDSTHQTQLRSYARRLSTLKDVSGVRTSTGVYARGALTTPSCRPTSGTEHVTSARCRTKPAAGSPLDTAHHTVTTTRLTVMCACDSFTPQGLALPDRLRAVPAPALFAGPTLELLDARQTLAHRLPLAALVVATAMFVLLLFCTRSLFLPCKALLINLLSLTGSFGAMVYVFQQGHMRWLVGHFTVTGTTDIVMPAIAFCLAFGLSMDYEILLLSRITEMHRQTYDTEEATARGLQAAAPLFTASAAVMAVVLLAMATSTITTLKLLAVTICISVVLDAVLLRPLLVPAVMRLAGAANWWLPSLGRNRRPVTPLEAHPPAPDA